MKVLNRIELISYTQNFLSFLFRDEQIKESLIKNVILFGSVARGDFDEKSDIDLFVNLYKKEREETIKKIVNRRLEKFYKSEEFRKWALRGIKNEINIKVGVLEEWDLKKSIISEGISLYDEYKEPPEGRRYFLFTFLPIKPVEKRNKVIRKLFGRKDYNKKGLVERKNGRKLTPRSFIIPFESIESVKSILDKENVDYQFFEIFSNSF